VKRLIVFLFALLASAPAQADDMAVVANSFYTTYLSLPRTGGIPDATARVRYAPLLSPRLTALIASATAAEARFLKQNKNAPPLIEGDLFSSMFEGFSRYKLGSCSGDAGHGQCNVTLTNQDQAGKPISWTDTLILINTPAGWKVDDIAYNAGFAFGNTGLLSDTLKMAIAEAPS
jgi:hypothetical protein